MKNNGILIIGGTGFIGSALVRRLQLQSDRPLHVVARHVEQTHFKNVFTHRGSIDDADLMRRILPLCSTIIHAASTTTPGVSATQPTLEAVQNILPTLRFLELLIEERSKKQLIFFSSGGTFYGKPVQSPVSENASFSPQSYYGAGKVALEAFLKTYEAQSGSAVVILRPSNVYGIGQAYRPGFGLIRTIFEHSIRGTPLEIWGNGEIIRDFIYIDDLIDACAMILANRALSGSYNIGYGRGHSINNVLQAIEAICEKRLTVMHVTPRKVDVQSIVLDIERIHNVLKWKPEISLERGLKLTWNWLNSQAKNGRTG